MTTSPDECREDPVEVVVGDEVTLPGDDGTRRDPALIDATTQGSGIVELHYDLAGE